MKTEDSFGIKIPVPEAEQIVTIGDLHETVWRHLTAKHSYKCKSQMLFYKLRKAAAESFNFSPQHFKPETSPEEVFPLIDRRKKYLYFAENVQLNFPPLVLTRLWQNFLFTFALLVIGVVFITSLLFAKMLDSSNWRLILIPPVLIILSIGLVSALLTPQRTFIKAPTLRVFIQQIQALNYPTLVATEGVNRKEMESVINHIVADMTGIEPENINAEKKIADDLGID